MTTLPDRRFAQAICTYAQTPVHRVPTWQWASFLGGTIQAADSVILHLESGGLESLTRATTLASDHGLKNSMSSRVVPEDLRRNGRPFVHRPD